MSKNFRHLHNNITFINMKKIVLVFLTIGLISCGSSKTMRDSKKIIKGDWTLSTITYNQTGTFNVSLFDDATKDCFESSSWNFIPNNNKGLIPLMVQNVQMENVILSSLFRKLTLKPVYTIFY